MNEEQGLKNVIDYIEAHIRESLSAEEIASACYYSRSNTKALFKKVFQYGMMSSKSDISQIIVFIPSKR